MNKRTKKYQKDKKWSKGMICMWAYITVNRICYLSSLKRVLFNSVENIYVRCMNIIAYKYILNHCLHSNFPPKIPLIFFTIKVFIVSRNKLSAMSKKIASVINHLANVRPNRSIMSYHFQEIFFSIIFNAKIAKYK